VVCYRVTFTFTFYVALKHLALNYLNIAVGIIVQNFNFRDVLGLYEGCSESKERLPMLNFMKSSQTAMSLPLSHKQTDGRTDGLVST
jgi:hypothetical protein